MLQNNAYDIIKIKNNYNVNKLYLSKIYKKYTLSKFSNFNIFLTNNLYTKYLNIFFYNKKIYSIFFSKKNSIFVNFKKSNFSYYFISSGMILKSLSLLKKSLKRKKQMIKLLINFLKKSKNYKDILNLINNNIFFIKFLNIHYLNKIIKELLLTKTDLKFTNLIVTNEFNVEYGKKKKRIKKRIKKKIIKSLN